MPEQASELVPQRKLDLPCGIDDTSGTFGYSESAIKEESIQRSENMPVEGIGNVRLEYQRVCLCDRSAFDNRKILAEVMFAAGVAKRQG